jgi:alkanesulfonate monooxygenase SsuD/methylene tetrahydromethanopterin reductase-like flavin-dependent oxidoreductase (luciferase family)
VLDNLSGGRLEIGLGQGYRQSEFDAIGRSYKERTGAFEDALEVLQLAWAGDRFDYKGRTCEVRGGWLRPAPVRPGHPPLWVGAAAPTSRARAVRHGAGLIIAPLTDFAHTARQFAAFDAECDRQSVAVLRHALMREIMVADSAAEAIAQHQASLDFTYRVQYAPERTGLTRVDPATGERRPLRGDDSYYLSDEFIHERWFAGAPEEVANKIVEWQGKLRLDRFIFQRACRA